MSMDEKPYFKRKKFLVALFLIMQKISLIKHFR